MSSNIRILVVSAACAALSGCFGPTPYQVKAYNGGYDDKPVSGERHFVAFYGNGFTSREAVMKYWLYRCAEVTSKAGFDYFVLLSRAPRPGAGLELQDEIARVADIRRLEPGEAVLAKGVSGGSRVPTYTYIPGGGGTVTRWSASGVIEMYKGEPLAMNSVTFVAKDLLDKLGPEVRAGVVPGKGFGLPEPGKGDATAEADVPSAGGNEPVKLDDLKDLLPK